MTDAPDQVFKVTVDGNGVKVAKDIDADTAAEVLRLVMGGVGSAGPPPARRPQKARSGPSRVKGAANGAKAKRKATSPGIVKDLSLRPKGKKSFTEFVAEKQPKTHQQRQVVILYWLREFGQVSGGITTDHVNTCYIEAGWPRPTKLANALQVTAKKKGWIESSDMSDLRLTVRGEDMVVHELPPSTEQKK
ncbi:MAG: hypothetical protein ACLPUT_06230 [Solirubrobacteraceae bacterium]|jgi:hypothetical protein